MSLGFRRWQLWLPSWPLLRGWEGALRSHAVPPKAVSAGPPLLPAGAVAPCRGASRRVAHLPALGEAEHYFFLFHLCPYRGRCPSPLPGGRPSGPRGVCRLAAGKQLFIWTCPFLVERSSAGLWPGPRRGEPRPASRPESVLCPFSPLWPSLRSTPATVTATAAPRGVFTPHPALPGLPLPPTRVGFSRAAAATCSGCLVP